MSIVFPLVLASLIVIGTIALYQAYQGLFSSFVMFVLTFISAVVAWNYCEPLGWSLGKWHQDHLNFLLLFGGLVVLGGLAKPIMRTHRYARLAIGVAVLISLLIVGSRVKIAPDTATGNSYGQAITLVGLFVVTLLSLRAIFDNVVLGNMTFPWQVERAGGAIFGFFTGMIIMGTALVSWQLMPLGPGLLASRYQNFFGLSATQQKKPAHVNDRSWRQQTQINMDVSPIPADSWASYNRYDERMKLQAAAFPYADGFTMSFIEALSNGSIGAKQSFGQIHQDLLLEAWANRNGINFESRQAAPAKAIVSAKWRMSQEASPEPDADNKIRGILTLTLDRKACDENNVMRFKGLQVRLVGESGQSYWPKGIHLQNMPFSKLYGDLTSLAVAGEQGEAGYLQYKTDYTLWAKDSTEQTLVRREIRGCQAERLWWQVQLVGKNTELRLVPGSLGVVHKPSKNKDTTIELIFEIDADDEPDYVVFKRTAVKKVHIDKPQEKPYSDVESPVEETS